jgi:hypothetical protein
MARRLFFASLTSRSRARCMSLASVGNATAFGCTVVSTITWVKSDDFNAPARAAVARLSWIRLELFLAHPLAPARQRRAVEGRLVLEEFLAQNSWKYGFSTPPRAEVLVRQVVHGLEDRQTRHEPRRQRRMSGLVRIDRTEPTLEKPPVDGPGQFRQRVAHVDDLVEPRPEKIVLPALPTLLRPHRIASAR